MNVSEYTSNTVNKLPQGFVFTYSDIISNIDKSGAVIKALNRLADSGKLVKLSKGKFYRPERSPFGTLKPDRDQIIKDLLTDGKKITGYLTGYSVFSQLGLTTQTSNSIQIGKNIVRPSFIRERYNISFIKQKNTITKNNIPLLQILDSIRLIKKIPDTTLSASFKRLSAIIGTLSDADKAAMVKLAINYPPATRALLGAILDITGDSSLTATLASSLNPISTYKFGGAFKVIPTAIKWKIV